MPWPKGKTHSIKTRELISIRTKEGLEQMSPEAKENWRQARVGENNPFYGKQHTLEFLEKMRQAKYFLGKHHTEEFKAERRNYRHTEETKEVIRQNTLLIIKQRGCLGFVGKDIRGAKNPQYGKHPTAETLEKLSQARLGENNPFYGKCHSWETREKISQSHLKGREPKIPFGQRYYRTPEWNEWQKQVFERDDYTCRLCDARSHKGKAIYLQPHHIKRVADYPELVFKVSNGITLCYDCHNLTKGREKKYENYFTELLCLKAGESRQTLSYLSIR